jgi:hypothetical protein
MLFQPGLVPGFFIADWFGCLFGREIPEAWSA